MPIILAVILGTACTDGGSTGPGTTASLRFFNATTGMTGNGGFTMNGKFATGSAVAFGQLTQTCSTVEAGSPSFGFGAANIAGTALSGSEAATLNNQSITAGGSFTLVSTGPASIPTLFLLDDNFSGSLATNLAAVRFVSLDPAAQNGFTVFTGVLGAGGTLTATDLVAGSPTKFATVPSGSTEFTILNGHEVVITGSAATVDLKGGTVNTIGIIPNAPSAGFRLVNVPRCA